MRFRFAISNLCFSFTHSLARFEQLPFVFHIASAVFCCVFFVCAVAGLLLHSVLPFGNFVISIWFSYSAMCVYTKMRPYVSNAESNKNETKNEQYLKINRTHSPSYPGQKMMLDVCCAHTHTCSTVEHFRPEPTDRPTHAYHIVVVSRIVSSCSRLSVVLWWCAWRRMLLKIPIVAYIQQFISIILLVCGWWISRSDVYLCQQFPRWKLSARVYAPDGSSDTVSLTFLLVWHFLRFRTLSLSLPTHYRVHNMFVQEKWFEKSLNNGTEDRQHTPCKSIKQMDLLCSAKCKYK